MYKGTIISLRSHTCLVSKLHPPSPSADEIGVSGSHLWKTIAVSITILVSSTTKKSPSQCCPKPQSHPHPKNTPQVMDLSVGFPEIFAMYWYSGMPPHNDRHPREIQPILVMFCQNAWEISGKTKGVPFFFGGSQLDLA